jgi:hypothetical protein
VKVPKLRAGGTGSRRWSRCQPIAGVLRQFGVSIRRIPYLSSAALWVLDFAIFRESDASHLSVPVIFPDSIPNSADPLPFIVPKSAGFGRSSFLNASALLKQSEPSLAEFTG